MRGVFIVLLISLSVLALAEGMIVRPRCPRACTREYRPLCALWRNGRRKTICTFANKCILDNQICQTGRNWEVLSNRECPRNSLECSDLLK